MDQILNSTSPALAGILIILGIFVSIMWVVLPFAIFGIKSRLDQIVQHSKSQTELLQKISAVLESESPEKSTDNSPKFVDDGNVVL